MNIYIDKNLFKFTEKCLRDYQINLLELQRRKEYLEAILSRSPTDFKTLSELGTHIDGSPECCSTQSVIERINEDDEMIRLRKRTEPLTEFHKTLSQEEYRFIYMRYTQRQSWNNIADEMHISVDSARGYWRGRLVKRAAELLMGKIG